MNLKLLVTAASITALLGTAACTTTDPYSSTPQRNNTGTGALAGAVGGALLGYLTNTSDSEQGRKNALIGAGIGALGGAAVGQYMDRQQRELEAELSGSGVGVARQGDNLVLRMPSDVTFATNQSSINSRFYATLDDVSAILARYDQSTVDIIGHADADGADAYNLNLSRQRASSVAQYLVGHNVLPDRLYVDGKGESAPIASNDTAAGKAQNRRVEIVIRPFRG
ncbi:OmpA family protein [Brevundimonas lenta]|uniref:Outer membrane protein OmpA-like peptidoglycan-associated protein n=1 Tax=Brevundimonas lenta TaxID=424796 RepID=A0A7W6JCZ9_9CAUL|nr:OmpA family protein [Brevundimonas lenta]MBB4081882.1 outer membrane protein OmpA-like peptidoglycan-associated protein [Brevundimonas lenta]